MAAAAQIAPVKNTVLMILDAHTADVTKFIQDEIPNIKGPTCENIKIASDVGLAVDNIRNAFDYEGLLTKLANEVDAVFADQLTQLEKIVADLKAKDPMVMANLSSRALVLIESLVLKGWQPKLLGLSPTYAYVSNHGFETSCAGRFKYTASYPATCSLTIPDVRTELVDAKEGGVTFKAENMLSKDATEAKMKYAHVVKGEVEFKYNIGNIVTTLKAAKFDLWILCFPLSPGAISLTASVLQVTRQDKRVFSTSLNLAHKEATELNREITVKPTDGWRMTSKPRFICGEKTTELEPLEGRVTVALKLPDGEEKIEGKVDFDAEKDIYEEVETTKEIPLKWGQAHDFRALRFKVVFKTFDGQRFAFDKPDSTKPYLKVVQGPDDHFLLVAEVPPSK